MEREFIIVAIGERKNSFDASVKDRDEKPPPRLLVKGMLELGLPRKERERDEGDKRELLVEEEEEEEDDFGEEMKDPSPPPPPSPTDDFP